MKRNFQKIPDYENITFCSLQNHFDLDHTSFYIGYQSASSLIRNVNVVKPVFIIQCVISGKGIFEINGKRYPLQTGDVFLLPKNLPISYIADETEPFAYYYIGMDGVDMEKTLKLCGLSVNSPVRNYKGVNVPAAMKSIFHLMQQHSVSANLKALAELYELFSCMAENDPKNTLPLRKQDIDYINAAIFYIKGNYANDISVSSIAEKLGIGRTYFSWLFHRETGMTPQTYLLRYRISQACKLLNMEMSVTQASSQCGFNSPVNFSIQFKKIVGITPRAFQQRARDKDSGGSPEMPDDNDLLF